MTRRSSIGDNGRTKAPRDRSRRKSPNDDRLARSNKPSGFKKPPGKKPFSDKPSHDGGPLRGEKPANAKGGRPIRLDRDERLSRNDKPVKGVKPLGKKPVGNKSLRDESPTRNKKPFGSKPVFNKRPNFGDKPPHKIPGSDNTKSGASRRTAMFKKRRNPKRNASPQGGQGTLKRRR